MSKLIPEKPLIRPVSPAQNGDVMALAARAWPNEERVGQLASIRELLTAGKAEDFVLLAAHRGSELVGAALAQKLPGRSAVVWPPQLVSGENEATAIALLHEASRHLSQAGMQLAQTLLDDPQDPTAKLLIAAGFRYAGDLLYMSAELRRYSEPNPPLPFSLESWSPEKNERLIRVVEATYLNSLDCPLVDGLRETADVLTGYRAVGQFRPELWLLAQSGEQDAGCLLLADHPAQQQWEIVYLGIAPAFRGRGWGLLLARHALELAKTAGCERVVLAVDAANHPAVQAYAACGFVAWDRRSVLVRPLRT